MKQNLLVGVVMFGLVTAACLPTLESRIAAGCQSRKIDSLNRESFPYMNLA